MERDGQREEGMEGGEERWCEGEQRETDGNRRGRLFASEYWQKSKVNIQEGKKIKKISESISIKATLCSLHFCGYK